MKSISKILLLMIPIILLGCGKSETTMKPSKFAPPPTAEEIKAMKGDTAPGPP